MPIIVDQFNTLYVGGRKGKKFEIRYCPADRFAPWVVQSRGQGHYFETLREALAFVAGRGWIEAHMIKAYQIQIMNTLDLKLSENDED